MFLTWVAVVITLFLLRVRMLLLTDMVLYILSMRVILLRQSIHQHSRHIDLTKRVLHLWLSLVPLRSQRVILVTKSMIAVKQWCTTVVMAVVL